MLDRRERVLPELDLLRHPRADVARDRAHVAVQQLEPGPAVGVGELLGVVAEPLGDLAVLRVGEQREVARRHHGRVELALDVRIGHELLALGLLGLPLVGARGALGEIPSKPNSVSQ